MAAITTTRRVSMLCGLLMDRADRLDLVVARLRDAFGDVVLVSQTWPFASTAYYEKAMGPNLIRSFVAWPQSRSPLDLADWKRTTNALEQDLALTCRQIDAANQIDTPARPINLDPGYIAAHQLVLASAKNFGHRIPIAEGLYADLTLQYRHRAWRTLPWTFPEYAETRYHAFFDQIRDGLVQELAA